MSTRSTIALSGDYHLYHDGFDQQNVYLEIDSDYGKIVLRIPAKDWVELSSHVIYPHSQIRGMSDEEVEAFITQVVQERMDEWEKSDKSDILGLSGIATFGDRDSPLESQVISAMVKYGIGRFSPKEE